MKKYLVCVTLAAVVAFTMPADAGQSNYGCGVGSLLFKGNDGLLSQTLAITTNVILCNQAFGITFGTLGCSKFSTIASNDKVKKYINENMDNLAKDMARGQGEYLSTLAVLIDVKEENRKAVYQKLQVNFSKIYSSKQVTSMDVVKGIEDVLTRG